MFLKYNIETIRTEQRDKFNFPRNLEFTYNKGNYQESEGARIMALYVKLFPTMPAFHIRWVQIPTGLFPSLLPTDVPAKAAERQEEYFDSVTHAKEPNVPGAWLQFANL